ncbi:MAG: hypothetical protein LC642_06335, partial [Verrucomicrobiaceae bacterium]|nr:hypothetical protein [Verrucomicrobiaceae bacterium]
MALLHLMVGRSILTGLALVAFAAMALGQESPAPEPTPSAAPARNVRISFVPPPLEGTISLGVYNAKGNLVRVLFREADINEFKIGQDALSTTWDGKDDAGENVPPGKYSAHGFVVGDLKIEGVGFFFNDWITSADAPRFSRIRTIATQEDDLLLGVELVPNGTGHVVYDVASKTTKLKDGASDVEPLTTIPGRNGTRWVIDRSENGAGTVELKQLSSSGEFLRRLPVSANEPQPKAVAASLTEDKIYLLEQNDASQRVRGLSFVATKEGAEQPASVWKVDFEKWIVTHKDFSLVDGKPVAAAANANPPEKVKIKLRPNPLLNDDRVSVEVAIGVDGDGSFLKTSDGLPLCTVSETKALVRAVASSQGANTLHVFQDDGAVVEQFRVTGVDRMMS